MDVGQVICIGQYPDDLVLLELVGASVNLARLARARYAEHFGILYLDLDITQQAVITHSVLPPALKPSESGILLHPLQVQLLRANQAAAVDAALLLPGREQFLVQLEVHVDLIACLLRILRDIGVHLFDAIPLLINPGMEICVVEVLEGCLFLLFQEVFFVGALPGLHNLFKGGQWLRRPSHRYAVGLIQGVIELAAVVDASAGVARVLPLELSKGRQLMLLLIRLLSLVLFFALFHILIICVITGLTLRCLQMNVIELIYYLI